jgi:hypothetical protein
MPQLDPVLIVKIISFGCFLWLGIYIVSRAAVQTPLTIVSMVGLTSMATFFFSSAIIGNNTTPLGATNGILVTRFFWWSDVLPIAFWYHMTALIAHRERVRPVFTWSVLLVYAAAVFMTLAGSFSDLLLDYSSTSSLPGDRFYTPVNKPGYLLFIAYLLLVGAAAFLNLWGALAVTSQRVSPEQRALVKQLKLLVLGGFLFGGGGVWIAVNLYFEGYIYQEMLGYICLLLGLGCLGYGATHFELLIEGQNIERDFNYSLIGMILICLTYVIILFLTGTNSTLSLLAVVGLTVISHSTLDWTRGLLDKFFFTHPERTARAEARAYATAIASQPAHLPELEQAIAAPSPLEANVIESTTVPALPAASDESANLVETEVNEKSFNDMVRRAITGLKSPPQMIKNPLLSLRVVERRLQEHGLEDNRLNRVAALREILIEQIDRLRPAGVETSGTGDAWRFYNVLYYPYVREISRKGGLAELRRLQETRRRNGQRESGDLEKVLEWLSDVDEDTFYKWQRKASDTIAAILREEELKLKMTGNSPSPNFKQESPATT